MATYRIAPGVDRQTHVTDRDAAEHRGKRALCGASTVDDMSELWGAEFCKKCEDLHRTAVRKESEARKA